MQLLAGFRVRPAALLVCAMMCLFMGALAIDLANGRDVWSHEIPAGVVKGGTAIDHAGRIVVSLEDGRVMCFVGGG